MADSTEALEALLAQARRWRHDDTRRARGFAQQALAMAERLGDERSRAWALLRLALCGYMLGEPDGTHDRRLGEAIGLMRAHGDAAGEAEAMNLLASMLDDGGESEQSLALHARCLALHRGLGHLPGVSASLNNRGTVLRRLGRRDEARACLEESLAVAQQCAQDDAAAYAQLNLGQLELDAGALAPALRHLERAYAAVSRTDDRALECSVLLALARARRMAGQPAVAAELLEHAAALARRTGNVGDQAEVQRARLGLDGPGDGAAQGKGIGGSGA